MGNKRLGIIPSLERLVPTKEQHSIRQNIADESKKLREDREIEKCTFRPNFERTSLDWTQKVNKIPGIDGHIKRQRQSHQEESRKKSFFQNLGSKFKGELTEPKPFNLSESREPEKPAIQPRNKSLNNTKILNKSKPLIKNLKITSSRKTITSHQNDVPKELKEYKGSKESKESKESIGGDKFSKLRIHYTKDDFAEVKVYENSDPDSIVKEFTIKYGIGKPMMKQLYNIIKSKQNSLKSVNEIEIKNITNPDIDIEESKEGANDNNEDLVNMMSANGELKKHYSEDETDMLRDSLSLPIQEPSLVEHSSEIDEDNP
jgi:hypothetical protein